MSDHPQVTVRKLRNRTCPGPREGSMTSATLSPRRSPVQHPPSPHTAIQRGPPYATRIISKKWASALHGQQPAQMASHLVSSVFLGQSHAHLGPDPFQGNNSPGARAVSSYRAHGTWVALCCLLGTDSGRVGGVCVSRAPAGAGGHTGIRFPRRAETATDRADPWSAGRRGLADGPQFCPPWKAVQCKKPALRP